MEGNDVFQQQGDDPFAGSEFGDFEQPVGDQAAEAVEAPEGEPGSTITTAPTDDLPVVDREGAVIGSAPATDLPPSVQDDIASEAAQFEGAAPAAPSAEPPADEEAQAAPSPPAEPPQPPEQPQAAPPAEAPPEEPEDAEPPEEPKGKGGKVTKRRYVILRVDGPDRFTQVHWYEDSDGKLAQKGGGNKRQKVLLARGTEDALKFGFAAVGAPQDGATLIAVAAAYFQSKKIRPMPPEPSRQRLQIS